ncbi:uncharacterized protein LOC132035976 [Lycium ferocissimum]|uniref:uncharacterized protein LOC132035976 n=1 Tax=Lycium ferocissimum TaxID=112874 RepID=UPI0028151199|nr:uncharacterized protein LOC132035976 [Lycium ferocissimum]
MLLSPGHSPRHLSTPSPSPSQNPNNSSTLQPLPTTNNKRNSNKVLDEDTYVAAIEKIIERDFFPDIPKLRDRLDWLEAVRTRDPVQIRDAQLKIIERRGNRAIGSNTEGKLQTPSSSSTFFRNSSTTPFDNDLYKTPITPNGNCFTTAGNNVVGEADKVDVSLTLDEFFRRYTSEDNESFSKIIEKVNRKRKEKYGYLLEGEKEEEMGLIEDGSKRVKVVTDGYGTSDQPLATLEGWKYVSKNLLMYHPADNGEVALTEEERAVRLNGLTKEVSKVNTRFHGKMMESQQSREDETVAVLYAPVNGGTPVPFHDRGDKTKKYDLDDLRKTPNQFFVESGKKAENGYSFVSTPSPAPGVDESPFITWGEIEGTPLRLEQEDTPVDIGGSGEGPQYKIPNPPSRDVKAHSLSREAARKLRERSKMFQKPPLHTPVRGGSASPGARTLSPAAQKFMRKAIAKSSHSLDESLRASYRGASPGPSTPKTGRSLSRLGREGSLDSKSPSVREGSNPPW